MQFGATPATNVVCASTTQCMVTSPAGTGTASVRVTVAASASADTAADDFTFVTTRVYLLAEGATGAFFDEDVLLANPNEVEVPVTIRFLTDGGETIVTRTLARSRALPCMSMHPRPRSTAVSAEVTSASGLPIAVERSMFWDATHYAGHIGEALAARGTEWYFAEGAQGFFDTYLLVIQSERDGRRGDVHVPPRDRYAGYADRDGGRPIALHAGTPTIPELRDARSGHRLLRSPGDHGSRDVFRDDGGAALERRSWDRGLASLSSHGFAEGATGSFFDTFFLIGNP